MAIKNNVTLMTDPCGMPFSVVYMLDISLSALACIMRLFRKFFKKRNILPFIFFLWIILIILLRHAMSYAFLYQVQSDKDVVYCILHLLYRYEVLEGYLLLSDCGGNHIVLR
jgi:hypothetical protein